MTRITINSMIYNLIGNSITNGSIINFKAKDVSGQDFELTNLKGYKIICVISEIKSFLDEEQLKIFMRLEKQYPKINFLTITRDSVRVIKKWSSKNNRSNHLIISDKKYNEFGNITNLRVRSFWRLARGFLILDDNNKIVQSYFNEEQLQRPELATLKIFIDENTKK